MRTGSLTPVRVRLIIIGVMGLLVAIGVGVFIYGRGVIENYALEAQQTAARANASSTELDHLKTTKVLLASRESTIKKTSLLTSDAKLYVYQDKIVADITKYAADAGIEVKNFSYTDVPAAPATATTTAATVPATGAAPANIKSRLVTFTVASPVDYNKMLNFIHSIEQGVFRMRIANIGLSRSIDGGSISSDALTIEVFVR